MLKGLDEMNILEVWTGPESNWRHTAFQAVALPTELPVHF